MTTELGEMTPLLEARRASQRRRPASAGEPERSRSEPAGCVGNGWWMLLQVKSPQVGESAVGFGVEISIP